MRINELESQIAFQIKPLIQTQQRTIEFHKSRFQNLNSHNEVKLNETVELKSLDLKHVRTQSLNYTKLIKNPENLSKTDKIKIQDCIFPDDYFTINEEKMKKCVGLLKHTIKNLSYDLNSYKFIHENLNKENGNLSKHIKKNLKKEKENKFSIKN